MTLSSLLHNVPHEIVCGNTGRSVSQVVIDTRKMVQDALFVCVRGLNVDGHRYIMEAIERGAAAVLVEDKSAAESVRDAGVPIIYAENTRKAMGLIGANFYGHPAKKMRLVGVTGTNGKTTTTHFIENILRYNGFKTGLIGTEGVQAFGQKRDISFTTATTPDPLELHRIFAELYQMGVREIIMEVSSHALALHKLEGLVFDIGIFTNLTQDHLDFHGTMENYRNAKAQLFTQSRNAIINMDDPSAQVMLNHFTGESALTYSLHEHAALRALHVKSSPQGMTFDVEINGRLHYFTLPVAARFNVYNCLAAIGTAQYMGVATEAIQSAVAQIQGVPGHVQAVPNTSGVHVYVDYAHSPDGLENIIKNVREIVPGRVVTLFGCGGDRDREKRPIMGRIAGELSDYVILTSDNPRNESPMGIIKMAEAGVRETAVLYEIYENRREAIFAGVALLKEGDALIIAGKGAEDYQMIGDIKYPFCDYQVAQEALHSL